MIIPRFIGGAALLAVLVSAQTTTPTRTPASSSTTTSSSGPATITVNVAPDGLTYNPTTVQANINDTIAFRFLNGNHSVIRAEFLNPCIPYEYTNPGKQGFYSGFRNVIPGGDQPIWYLKVNVTTPVFYYCSAPDACIKNGMVGVINPSTTQTYDLQEAAALKAKVQLSPGDPVPAEAPSSTPTPSNTATPAPAPSNGGGGLSAGAIAGIVVGAVAVLAIAGLIFYLCGRNRSLAAVLRYSQPPPGNRGSTVPDIPYSPAPSNAPYSPGFSTQKEHPLPSPALHPPHDSWASAPVGVPRAMSPEMGENHYGNTAGYAPVEQNRVMSGSSYMLQSSPSEPPWSPNGFGHSQQSHNLGQGHEMSAGSQGQAGRPGLNSLNPTRISYMTLPASSLLDYGPHELDAPSEPGSAHSPIAPPEYRPRAFSFGEGAPESMPGVEKALRD